MKDGDLADAARRAGVSALSTALLDEAGVTAMLRRAPLSAPELPALLLAGEAGPSVQRHDPEPPSFRGMPVPGTSRPAFLWRVIEKIPAGPAESTPAAIARARTDLRKEKATERAAAIADELRKAAAGKPLADAAKTLRERLLAEPSRKAIDPKKRDALLVARLVPGILPEPGPAEPTEAWASLPALDPDDQKAVREAAFKTPAGGISEVVRRPGAALVVRVVKRVRPAAEDILKARLDRDARIELLDVEFASSKFEEKSKATDEEAKAYHAAHPDEFKDSGRTEIALLRLPFAATSANIQATEAEARKIFESEAGLSLDPSEREADFQARKADLLRRVRDAKAEGAFSQRLAAVEAALGASNAVALEAAVREKLAIDKGALMDNEALQKWAAETLKGTEAADALVAAVRDTAVGKATKSSVRGPDGAAWAIVMERKPPAVREFDKVKAEAVRKATEKKAAEAAKAAAAAFAARVDKKDQSAWETALKELKLEAKTFEIDRRGFRLPAKDAAAREAAAKQAFDAKEKDVLAPMEDPFGSAWHVFRRGRTIPPDRVAVETARDTDLRQIAYENARAFSKRWWNGFVRRVPVKTSQDLQKEISP